jgi:structural maintenance of chromosome 2
MHIKEIIIDGFKSYSVRTSIPLLDHHFNSITGLNGSGKSNILDAICFVLGISTLSHVRASNLNELIFKYGQAGINKASVAIIFDNTDKRFSPIGCEDYDEITVTRSIFQSKSKYYLNGYNATQESIKSLFQSVKLNINNPHFLIMQGKVTQVVNMKPLEILGLLEEAAGTSMYENKKENALKTIKKKEHKLEEINKIISEDITPQLEKLLKDKQNYLTWKSRENEISRISKLLTALDYYKISEGISNKYALFDSLKKSKETNTQEVNSINSTIENLNKEMSNIENLARKENDQMLHDLENSHKLISNEMKNFKLQEDNLKKNNNNSIKEIYKLENENSQIQFSMENMGKAKLDKENSLAILEKELELKNNLLKEYERNLENVKAGKVNQDGEIFNMNKIINETKNNLLKCGSEKNNLKNQIKFLQDQRANKKSKLFDYQKSIEQMKKQAVNIDKQIIQIKRELGIDSDNSQINLDENEPNSINPQSIEILKKEISHNDGELLKLEDRQNDILRRYANRVETNYRDPEPNFDRRKVKGKVLRLFSITDEKYATALEQLAGARLYNVVTDNERTSSLLFSRKCFDSFVTTIPNSKINFREFTTEVKRFVIEIAGNEAKLAIDLINFERELLPTMQYVFGSTYVCTSTEVAKKLTFNSKIKARCVNLEGDIFDAQGTVTGGAIIRNSENILVKVKELNYIQENIKECKEKLNKKKEELEKYIENMGKNNSLKAKLENLSIEMNELNDENISRNSKNFENEIIRSDNEIKRIEERIKSLAETENNYSTEIQKLTQELEDFKKSGSSKEIYNKKIKEVKMNLLNIDKNIKNLKKIILELEFNIKQRKEEVDQNMES